MAPEIRQESKQRHVSPKCDVYSFGVLLIELVNGSRFTLERLDREIHQVIQWVQNIHVDEDGFQEFFEFMIKNSIEGFNNNEAKLFLQISLKCIQEDPKKRPTMEEILQMLEESIPLVEIGQNVTSISDYMQLLVI
jgi:serine/threonine protein kinase